MQYARVPVPAPAASELVAGLIVGEPVQARTGQFELYYLFPLTAEQQTIALMQRTVMLAGLGAGPPRPRRSHCSSRGRWCGRCGSRPQTAGRLAAGDLSQRIAVRGTDDIARLGRSFNDMADSLQRQIRRLEDLSRLQRRFTSDVSHELRTPLTTIRMAAEYLHGSRADFPPELARAAELLHAELDRFESLLGRPARDLPLRRRRRAAGVRDRPTSAGSSPRPSRRTGCSPSGTAARSSSTRRDEPVTVDMDSRRVERILRNLVGNALDHGEGSRS